MRKRADLAVALIHEPDVLVLDEPLTGLDLALQKFIWELLEEIASKGKIIIISSHRIVDLEKHCNRFGLISEAKYLNHNEIEMQMKKSGESSLQDFLEKEFTR